MTTNERTVGRYLCWLLAALSAGAAFIHFAVSGEHYDAVVAARERSSRRSRGCRSRSQSVSSCDPADGSSSPASCSAAGSSACGRCRGSGASRSAPRPGRRRPWAWPTGCRPRSRPASSSSRSPCSCVRSWRRSDSSGGRVARRCDRRVGRRSRLVDGGRAVVRVGSPATAPRRPTATRTATARPLTAVRRPGVTPAPGNREQRAARRHAVRAVRPARLRGTDRERRWPRAPRSDAMAEHRRPSDPRPAGAAARHRPPGHGAVPDGHRRRGRRDTTW